VAETIESETDAIAAFIESADDLLTVERETTAELATRPVLPVYEASPGRVEQGQEQRVSSIPALDPAYTIDMVQLAALKRVIALADETGQPQNIGLHGPAGSGKTTLGVQVGALRKAPTFVVDSTDKETANDWFGTQQLNDGTMTVTESDFVRAVETPGAVVVLDDVALIQARTVQNGLNALLDPSRRAIYVQQLEREVRVAPGVIFVGTWNVGAEYTGTSDLSLQIIDRFRAGALFEVPYPENGVLAGVIRARSACTKPVADRLANVAEWLLADPMPIETSTRGLIAAGQHVRQGATIGHALWFTVFGELDAETKQRAYGIISVNLSKNRYEDAERVVWEAPRVGAYVSIAADVSVQGDV